MKRKIKNTHYFRNKSKRNIKIESSNCKLNYTKCKFPILSFSSNFNIKTKQKESKTKIKCLVLITKMIKWKNKMIIKKN
jgi:hypothetical protein